MSKLPSISNKQLQLLDFDIILCLKSLCKTDECKQFLLGGSFNIDGVKEKSGLTNLNFKGGVDTLLPKVPSVVNIFSQ